MTSSWLSELASMSLEATAILNGIEEMSFIESYQHTTGDEPPCLHITPNSTSPSSLGGITSDPRLSLTRYQWHELYEAWKLAIPSPSLQRLLVFPPKGQPHTLRMDMPALSVRLKENLLSIASTTYISAKRYSKDSQRATLSRNYALST